MLASFERLGRNFITTLTTGILIGFGIAYMTHNPHGSLDGDEYPLNDQDPADVDISNFPGDDLSVTDEVDEDALIVLHKMENVLAKRLFQEVRVVCLVMTSPLNHQKKAKPIKATWGKRCNKLIFISSQTDTELGAIALKNKTGGKDRLWANTREAFKYVYDNFRNDYDWFMKADDDTYVIVENLRHLLKDYDPMYPIHFGCKFKRYMKQGYMSSGAGYVLSLEALKRFATDGVYNRSKCRPGDVVGGVEDVEMGKCMENLGVEAGDSRDDDGGYRFLQSVPQIHIIPGQIKQNSWYWKHLYYPQKQGAGCCSDTAISFHSISPKQMYVLDYFLYRVKPYGISIAEIDVIPAINPVATVVSPTPPLLATSKTKASPLSRTTLKSQASLPELSQDGDSHLAEDPTKASDWLAPDDRRA